MRGRLSRWLPLLLYAAIITFFSSRSGTQLPRWDLMHHDKVLHALEYAGFGLLLCRGFSAHAASAIVAGGLFGVLDEFHQSFVPGRNGNDPGDMLADLVGATVGALVFVALSRILRQRRGGSTETA
jgi:VanZ family protein